MYQVNIPPVKVPIKPIPLILYFIHWNTTYPYHDSKVPWSTNYGLTNCSSPWFFFQEKQQAIGLLKDNLSLARTHRFRSERHSWSRRLGLLEVASLYCCQEALKTWCQELWPLPCFSKGWKCRLQAPKACYYKSSLSCPIMKKKLGTLLCLCWSFQYDRWIGANCS